MLRELAHACGSTALALAMHTHLLAATVWRWRQGQQVDSLLKRIVAEETVLISSGASDWLDSSGKAEKVDGGFRVTARKIFSSGCPMGDLLITSAVYDDPQDGPTVLHFPVPFTTAGVTIMDNWRTGYPSKPGHYVTSITYGEDLMALSGQGQRIDLR
jgi:alkylation response protein AidB-like acyl-CoA dehydrogenase